MKSLCTLVAVLAALLSTELATAQSYSVANVGNLGYPVTTAQGINDNGEVVGTAAIELADGSPLSRAYFWTKRGGMHSIGTLSSGYGVYSGAYGVSSSGFICGYSTSKTSEVPEGFLWSSAGGMTGINYGLGMGVNDSGEVVGYFHTGHGETFGWSSTVNLNTSGYTGVEALGVNDAGFIAGTAFGAKTGLQEALLWTPENEIFALGTLPGGRHSEARAVSSNNIVVGGSDTSDNTTHAFLWTRTGGMQDLGILSGYTSCIANGVNSSGVVVGQCTPASGTPTAFVWTSENGMENLNELLTGNPYATLISANGINTSGQIAATGGTGNPTYGLVLYPVQ